VTLTPTVDPTAGNAELPPPLCRREPNGSWSVWIDGEESVVRQHWGASNAQLKSFSDVVIGLGLLVSRIAPNRLRFSINDVLNDAEEIKIAMTMLAAFRQLFLEKRQPRKRATATPSSRTGQEAAHTAGGPDPLDVIRPASDGNENAVAFPTLFNDDGVGRTDRSATRMKEKALDQLAVVRQAYPAIGAAIEATWGNIECKNYLNKLIMNSPGNYQGFSTPVLAALLALYRIHTREFKFPGTPDKRMEDGRRNGRS
jgi:hypothetical protein